MTALVLHRTDTTRNMRRFYLLDVQRDLFGQPSVLLNNRVVRAGISYALACDWDHKYGPKKDRPVKPSDARDLQHVILATAASGVRVVRDTIFTSRLDRAGVDLEVLDFDEFVARVL
jgi:hypothetical protein